MKAHALGLGLLIMGLVGCGAASLRFQKPSSESGGSVETAVGEGEARDDSTEAPPTSPPSSGSGDDESDPGTDPNPTDPAPGTPPDPEGPDAPLPPVDSISYASVLREVLEPRCLNCHGILPDGQGPRKLPDLSDLERLRTNAQKIRETVLVKQTMPTQRDVTRNGPLSPMQLDLLKAWLDAGLPD